MDDQSSVGSSPKTPSLDSTAVDESHADFEERPVQWVASSPSSGAKGPVVDVRCRGRAGASAPRAPQTRDGPTVLLAAPRGR